MKNNVDKKTMTAFRQWKNYLLLIPAFFAVVTFQLLSFSLNAFQEARITNLVNEKKVSLVNMATALENVYEQLTEEQEEFMPMYRTFIKTVVESEDSNESIMAYAIDTDGNVFSDVKSPGYQKYMEEHVDSDILTETFELCQGMGDGSIVLPTSSHYVDENNILTCQIKEGPVPYQVLIKRVPTEGQFYNRHFYLVVVVDEDGVLQTSQDLYDTFLIGGSITVVVNFILTTCLIYVMKKNGQDLRS